MMFLGGDLDGGSDAGICARGWGGSYIGRVRIVIYPPISCKARDSTYLRSKVLRDLNRHFTASDC